MSKGRPDPAWLVDDVLAEYRGQYEHTGDGHYLLKAIDLCLKFGRPAPSWLDDTWSEAMSRWHDWEAPTIGEALGIEDRPSDPRTFRKHKRYKELSVAINEEVEFQHLQYGEGRPLDQCLFEEVAEKFGIGSTQAKDIYYLHKKRFSA